jgi:hypothetical protein
MSPSRVLSTDLDSVSQEKGLLEELPEQPSLMLMLPVGTLLTRAGCTPNLNSGGETEPSLLLVVLGELGGDPENADSVVIKNRRSANPRSVSSVVTDP